MLITKIFHLRQPLPEALQRLRELGSGSKNNSEVSCSIIESKGIGHFEFTPRPGERVSTDIQEVRSDDPNRILFRSVGDNAGVAGMVEFFSIRPNLTEVVLTLDYDAVSPLQKTFDNLDRFLNRQIAWIEGCLERARAAGAMEAGEALSGKVA